MAITSAQQDRLWASALSLRIDPLQALAEALEIIDDSLDCAPDLVLLFATGHHLAAFPSFARRLRDVYPRAHFVGCSAQGVIGGGREAERREALSLVAGVMPGVVIKPVRLEPEQPPESAWLRDLCVEGAGAPHLVLLPEPFSCDIEGVLKAIDQDLPEATCVGGLVSGAEGPDESTLLLDDDIYFDGLVGISLSGAIEVEALISQGCRPVGEPMIVTRAKENIVHDLNIGRPTDALQRLYKMLSPREQALCHTSLMLGVERKAQSKAFTQNDFLITEVQGMEPNTGAMAVGRRVRNYQVVQFHLRDAVVAAADLQKHLAELPQQVRGRARGALLFSGAGRGEALYGAPDRDIAMVSEVLGSAAIGGFFSNGEIAQIGGSTHVHGCSAVVSLLCPKADS